jgi:protein-S-isoprenylcysteine O-methyltransferase Ste14
VSYVGFLAVFLYAIGFVNNLVVPKTISGGVGGNVATAAIINILLLSVFAVQHTIMARPAFKAWWTKIIPEAAERTTFVMASNLCLALIFWQWQPMPEIIWKTDNDTLRIVLMGISIAGFGFVVFSSFLIDHFDLFGLRQVYLNFQGKEYTPVKFQVNVVYKYLRNPLMLGFIIAFWSTPTLSQAHLLFAAVVTGYIFFGIHIEERDIAKSLGEDYQKYRSRTNMLFPMPPRGDANTEA